MAPQNASAPGSKKGGEETVEFLLHRIPPQNGKIKADLKKQREEIDSIKSGKTLVATTAVTPAPTSLKPKNSPGTSPTAGTEDTPNTVRRDLSAAMGWSVIKNGKPAPETDTSPGSSTLSTAASTPPPLCSGAVDPSLTGAVPTQFGVPLTTKWEGVPEHSKKDGCVTQGLNRQEAQKFLTAYAKCSKPMAVIAPSLVQTRSGIRY